MRRIINIESRYSDRAVEAEVDSLRQDVLLIISRTRGDKEMLFAYLTARGARDLIDALEPFAAPKARPPIDVIDVLNERLLP